MPFDDLDRRIVGALQVDGRASWRRIAEVLDAPFTTVTRHGSTLLASGAVRVVASPISTPTSIMEVSANPQRVDAVARALAARPDTIFVYTLGAPACILVEEHQQAPGALARAVIDEIPVIDGVTDVRAAPILAYYRTLTSWMPNLLSASEVTALNANFGTAASVDVPMGTPVDLQIQSILERDGRAPVADIAAELELSEPAVRRRVNGLIGTRIEVRAVVAPAMLGLGVSAFLWLRVAPSAVRHVAEQILASPFVRYAAMTMGEYQLVVDVAVATLDELRIFLTDQPWASSVQSIRSSPVLAAYKRSGVLVDESSPFCLT